MEQKKTDEVELITKEQVDHVVESLTKAREHAGQEKANKSKVDFEKTEEVLRSLEGKSIHTVVAILTTAFLILPIDAVAAVVDMGKGIIRAKAVSDFLKALGSADCPDCEGCEDCAEGECPVSETKE